MKKLIITTIFAFGFGMSLNAQSDGFFTTSYDEYRENSWDVEMPLLPGSHGYLDDYSCVEQEAPIGSGVLLLAALAMLKLKLKNEN